MHQGIVEPDKDADSPLREFQSRIYRVASHEDAFLLDITPVKKEYTDLQCMQEISAQHPKIYACSILRDGPTQYLELYIEKDDDDNDLMEHGVVFKKSKLRIFPCKAADATLRFVTVKLSQLPL
ncbi:hypothetical protein CU098_000115, partial [Rhizopus stolonifer]